MHPNLMPKKWSLAAHVSEWKRQGVDSSFISSGRPRHTFSKRKKARRFFVSGIPAVSAEPPIVELSYNIEGKNPPNLSGKIEETGESVPYL
ncbi:MAG TPA: hypothetical protein VL913_00665 [Candidatus Micrarchaeaceae archaeon]|nr:hypothetical protein [Candidatus Micrarchaeaceae archaeon]